MKKETAKAIRKLTALFLSVFMTFGVITSAYAIDEETEEELEDKFQDAMSTTENDGETEGEYDYTYYVSKYGNLYFNSETGTVVSADTDLRGTLTVPETINGVTVTRIGRNAFNGCIKLSTINLPDTVTYIGPYAFYLCRSMTSFTFPAGITEVSDYTFYYCIGLRSISIPEQITKIGKGAFLACTSLTSVDISANVEEVGYGAFTGCILVTAFNVDENNPYYVSINGVMYTKDLTYIMFYPSGSYSKTYDVLDGVVYVYAGCFTKANYLQYVTLPDTVKVIYPLAFYQCEYLETVTIPSSVKYMHTRSFEECPNLTVYVESGSYAEEAASKAELTTGNIDDVPTTTSTTTTTTTTTESTTESTTSVIDESSTESTTSVIDESSTESTTGNDPEIPTSGNDIISYETDSGTIEIVVASGCIYSIDNTASVVIPESVESEYYGSPITIKGILKNALANCPDLVDLTLPNTIEYIEEGAFDQNPDIVITCDDGSYAAYYALENDIDMILNMIYDYGDVNGDGSLSAADAASILQKVLNDSYTLPIEDKVLYYITYGDVNGDGSLSAADAAAALQKTLNSSYLFSVETA